MPAVPRTGTSILERSVTFYPVVFLSYPLTDHRDLVGFDGFSMVFGPKLSAKRPEHLQKVFLDLKFDSGSI